MVGMVCSWNSILSYRRFDDIPPELEREVERTAVTNVVTHSAPMQVIPSIHRSQRPPDNVPPPTSALSTLTPSASASTSTLSSVSTSVSNYPVEPDTAALVQKCHDFLEKLRSNPMVVQRLNNIGPMPEDIGLFTFYVASVRHVSFPSFFLFAQSERIRTHRSSRLTSTRRRNSCPSARPASDCALSCTGSSNSSSTGGSKVLGASPCDDPSSLSSFPPHSWTVLVLLPIL